MRLLRLHRQVRGMGRLERQVDRLVAEQASEWVEIMKKPSMLERLVFARFLKKHERHAESFLLMEAIERGLNGIDAGRRHDVNQLLAAAASAAVPLEEQHRGESHRVLWRWRLASIATALVIAAVAAWWAGPLLGLRWQTIDTALGEQRVLELTDGSVVHLNTQSRVQARLTAESRDIRLIAGEALFKVARDNTRPFRVHAGATVIRALGTQFNVRLRPEGTDVAVIDGKVEVSAGRRSDPTPSSTQLGAGEEAHVSGNKPVLRQATTDVARITAWRQRRLMFRMDSLGTIANEFNRYNATPRVLVEGEAARTRRFSGVFDADNPEVFAQTLADDPELTVIHTDEGILIRAK
jgi:transmembrane sensor